MLFFIIFFHFFLICLAASAAKYCEKGLAAIGKGFGWGLGRVWKAANFGNAGFWRLKAPKTRISGA